MGAKRGERLLPYVYHERQEPGSMMCAQHALNGILQGQFFDASQLGQIAEEIATYERGELGIEPGDANANEVAQHMDDTGFFSVEVLDRAFKTWSLNLARWRKQGMPERYDHPEREFAFVLNLGSHWVAIRGFGRAQRQWFNLNSFFAKPQWLGEAYLGTFLHTAEQEGYSVFVVEQEPGADPLDSIADDMAETGLDDAPGTVDAPITVSDDDDPELQEALRLSREEFSQRTDNEPHSLTPRRRRARELSSGSEENDVHVDAIAPLRHRSRNDPASPVLEPLPTSGHRSQRRWQQRAAADDPVDTPGMRPSRSRRNSRRQSSSDILDSDELPSIRRSPFLAAAASTSLFDDDVQEIDSSDSEHEAPAPPHLDDDDEQLQAVIAASLGQPYEVSDRIRSHTERELQRTPSAPTSVPADVERIRRLREAAQKPPESAPPANETKAPSHSSDHSEEEDETESEAPAVSAEEMRRLRLARFG